jgi:ADP-heptose:LPS heptosyltransferase
MLVIRPGGLGDAALTFPMLKALRAFYRETSLQVLAEARNVDIYGASPDVDRVFCYDRNGLSTFRRLRQVGFDVIIDTEQFHHLSTVISNFLKPVYLCGFDTLDRGRLLTHPVSYSDDTYEVLSFLDLAEGLTGRPVMFDPESPFITAPAEAQSWAREALSLSDGLPIAVVMPGATSVYRHWPSTRYAEIVKWLVQRGFRVVLLGGKDAVPACQSIAEGLSPDHVLNLAGRTTVLESLAILEKGDICLCADTGVLHLAYGVGTPTVSLFGPGNFRKWAPPGDRHIAIRKDLPCSPCTEFGKTPPCSQDLACMKRITVEDVTGAIEGLLGR